MIPKKPSNLTDPNTVKLLNKTCSRISMSGVKPPAVWSVASTSVGGGLLAPLRGTLHLSSSSTDTEQKGSDNRHGIPTCHTLQDNCPRNSLASTIARHDPVARYSKLSSHSSALVPFQTFFGSIADRLRTTAAKVRSFMSSGS